MKFIGDVHANFDWYNRIISKTSNTIQLGDFGIGFESYSPEPLNEDLMIKNNHQVLRGNHDNPEKIKNVPGYIPDGEYDKSGNVFCIGGAQSIDRQDRINGVNWWDNEEIDEDTYENILSKIIQDKPEIIASHDMPLDAYFLIHHPDSIIKTNTNQMLDHILSIHKPKVWVFGHHHVNLDVEYNGTRFICVKDLDIKEI